LRPFAIAAALGLLVVGCRATSDPNALELWTMQLKPTFTTYVEGVLADWRKDHPDRPVTWIDVPANGLENKLLAAVAGGNPPDLVNLNAQFAAKLAQQKALAPLDSAVAPVKGLYFPKVWEACQANGTTFAVPWYLSTAVTMANSELLTAAGLPPKPPATYAEAAAMGATLKANTGKALFMPNFGDTGKFMELLVTQGVPLLNGKKPAFATAAGEKALQYWVDLYKAGIIPKESLTEKHREAIDRFQAGQLGMLTSGPQFLTIVKENAPQLYPRVVIGQQLTDGPVGVGVMNLVVPAASPKKEAAAELALFLTNDKNQLALAKLAPVLPSAIKATQDAYFTGGGSDAISTARRVSVAQLPKATVLVPAIARENPELAKALDMALQQACLGQKTPKAALEEAAATWRAKLGG
jgi:putative chitobiose transport system substrate-binding protein